MNLIRIDKLFDFEKGSLQSSKCVAGNYTFITASADWKTHYEYTHDTEALVFAAAASGSLGRTHYVNGKFVASDLCFILSPKDPINLPVDLQFYHILFNELRNDIVKNTKSGTSKEAIGLASFGKYEIPYLDVVRQTVIKNRLVTSEATREKLSSEHSYQLNLLTKLRQQILQDAVHGKLIPQDPNDEPASKLLERIKAEKEKLVQEKKIKMEKPLPSIKQEEIPFEIPGNWVFCRWLDLLSNDKHSMKRGPFGSTLRKDFFVKNGIRVFEQYNPINDDPYWARYYISDEKYKELQSFTAKSGDLLISCSGVTLGRITEIPDDADFGIINQALLKLTLNNELISNAYFKMLFRSIFMQRLIFGMAWGTAIHNMIGVNDLKKLIIPLPPVAEQHRIVAKIEQLIKLCDELEQTIQQNQEYTQDLLQIALKEALDPN